MNITKSKNQKPRKQRLLENIENFEHAFTIFKNLPPQERVVSRFLTREESLKVLGYDDIFKYDYEMYRQIIAYYKTGAIGSKVKLVVPCDDIYNRLIHRLSAGLYDSGAYECGLPQRLWTKRGRK